VPRLSSGAREAYLVRSGTLTETLELADVCARRSNTYWLLSRFVLEPPTAAFLSALATALDAAPVGPDAPLGDETAALCRAVREALGDESARDALLVEHTRLFGGLSKTYGAPPPYESVAREGKLLGECTIAVSAAYSAAGFDAPVPEAGPADHLGAELRFLALLCHRESEARQAGCEGEASAWLERERSFLDDHVLKWVPQHCERMLTLAQTPFHLAMIRLISGACMLDRQDVTELSALAAVSSNAA